MMDISLSFIWTSSIHTGVGYEWVSSYEVCEDVVETGLFDAPHYFILLTHQLEASGDIFLGNSEGKSGLKLVYHL